MPFREVMECAEKAVLEGPWSVMRKKVAAPSGDMHDYHSRAPYLWPDPNSKRRDHTPYIRIDGKRAPGTTLYGKDSDLYDRDSLANMLRNTTCVGFASYLTHESAQHAPFAAVAARNVRAWFLDPDTRMNPHGLYSQVMLGHNDNMGSHMGVIDFKNFAMLLDVIKLLAPTQALSATDMAALRAWFSQFAKYLDTAAAAKEEQIATNNHGTYYDVLRAAIALFVDDLDRFFWIIDNTKHRILEAVDNSGLLPHELVRPTRSHYLAFGLQPLFVLAGMAERVGIDLWGVRRSPGGPRLLLAAAVANVPVLNTGFRLLVDDHDFAEVVEERWLALVFTAMAAFPELAWARDSGAVRRMWCVAGVLGEHDGVAMFWNLGLSAKWGIEDRGGCE